MFGVFVGQLVDGALIAGVEHHGREVRAAAVALQLGDAHHHVDDAHPLLRLPFEIIEHQQAETLEAAPLRHGLSQSLDVRIEEGGQVEVQHLEVAEDVFQRVLIAGQSLLVVVLLMLVDGQHLHVVVGPEVLAVFVVVIGEQLFERQLLQGTLHVGDAKAFLLQRQLTLLDEAVQQLEVGLAVFLQFDGAPLHIGRQLGQCDVTLVQLREEIGEEDAPDGG